MRKMLVVLLVAGALVGGGVTYALVSDSSPATAQEDEDDAATEQDVATDEGAAEDQAAADTRAARDANARAAHTGRADILGQLLDEAVADGVITQEQADQLRAAWDAKREELRGSIGEGPGGHGGRFGGPLSADIEMFLEDGVIDADELATLPEGSPLTDPDGPAAEYLEDGQITEEELQELLPSLRGGSGNRHGVTDEETETG